MFGVTPEVVKQITDAVAAIQAKVNAMDAKLDQIIAAQKASAPKS